MARAASGTEVHLSGVEQDWRTAHKFRNRCAESGVPNHQYINPPPVIQRYHSAVLSYHTSLWAEVAEQSDAPDYWTETIETVEVPVSGRYDGGISNAWGEPQYGSWRSVVDTESVPVTCDSLQERWSGGIQRDIEIELDNGESVDYERIICYLPVRVLNQVYQRLLRAQSGLGWTQQSDDLVSGDAGFDYSDLLDKPAHEVVEDEEPPDERTNGHGGDD